VALRRYGTPPRLLGGQCEPGSRSEESLVVKVEVTKVLLHGELAGPPVPGGISEAVERREGGKRFEHGWLSVPDENGHAGVPVPE
jgi:hypothetical protein